MHRHRKLFGSHATCPYLYLATILCTHNFLLLITKSRADAYASFFARHEKSHTQTQLCSLACISSPSNSATGGEQFSVVWKTTCLNARNSRLATDAPNRDTRYLEEKNDQIWLHDYAAPSCVDSIKRFGVWKWYHL